MQELSYLAGLSDSQQAALFRALLTQNDREDLTIKNLSGNFLNSRNLVAKLQAATGIKAPAVVSRSGGLASGCEDGGVLIAHLPVINVPRSPRLFEDRHIGSFREGPSFEAMLNNLRILLLVPPHGDVTMKLPGQCQGWATRMRKIGYRVSSRAARFGHQEHTLVKNGTSVTIRQGGSAVVRNKLELGTFIDAKFLADLKAVGALVETKETTETDREYA